MLVFAKNHNFRVSFFSSVLSCFMKTCLLGLIWTLRNPVVFLSVTQVQALPWIVPQLDAVVRTQQLHYQEGFLVSFKETVAGEDITEQCCGFGILFPNLGFSVKHPPWSLSLSLWWAAKENWRHSKDKDHGLI